MTKEVFGGLKLTYLIGADGIEEGLSGAGKGLRWTLEPV